MRIVIPGGSGQVGTVLAHHFHTQGHTVTVLTRNPPRESMVPWRVLLWNGISGGDWEGSLDGADVCINLAGRSVNCRYNPAKRAAILNSRVNSTRILGKVIASLAHPPAVWLNASTSTIYRHALDRPQDELTGELGGSEPGAPQTWNFSIAVARAWEAAFDETPTPRTRKVALRSAITLSPDPGGVFDVLLALVRFGLGGAVGPGTQYVSWIHGADFIRAVEFLIAHPELEGAINLASPHPSRIVPSSVPCAKPGAHPSACPPPPGWSRPAPSSCAPSPNSSSNPATLCPPACSTPASPSCTQPGPRPPATSSPAGAPSTDFPFVIPQRNGGICFSFAPHLPN